MSAPDCSVCGLPMVLGQPGRHWICSPVCDGCHRPVGPNDENCLCPAGDVHQLDVFEVAEADEGRVLERLVGVSS